MQTRNESPSSSDWVYVLQHQRRAPDGTRDVKMIGVYTTREAAEAARDKALLLPGFSELGARAFFVDEYELDADHWMTGFSVV